MGCQGVCFFLATLEVAGLLGFLGGLGGGLGVLVGGVLSPLQQQQLLLLLLRVLLLLFSPPSSATLTQPLRYGSMPPPPPLLPASHLPNRYSTERAMLGSFPNMWPNSVTPTRCVHHRATPPAPRGGRLHTTAGSRPDKKNKRQVCLAAF